VDHFQTVEDAQAVQAMRTLAQGQDGDMPVVAGESGVAGLAALQALRAMRRSGPSLGWAPTRVLLIGTEGATAPQVYAPCVGEGAAQVLQRQAQWLARSS
jgi:diaminopropionate ammonia-lyase